jgi:hypothetical protein
MQSYRLFIIALFPLLLSACKQEQTPAPQKESYVQFFTGAINNKRVDIKTQTTVTYQACESCNIESISGDWTGFTSINKDAYAVTVFLAKENPADAQMPKLKFRIFDIKPATFKITGEEDIYSPLATYIVLLKKGKTDAESTFYTANQQYKPFEITINKYVFNPDSGLPVVGGRLNGVLYNTTNHQDSIVLKDCTFEVKY